MDYGAIDLHKTASQVRIITASGDVIDRRIATSREKFAMLFGGRPRMRVLVEASTESEWVAQHLEALGHEVIVADPNYAPMYGMRSRRVKTDLRDVAALVEACQHGFYRAVHRRSAQQRAVQTRLNVRQEFVAARTRAIAQARAITRAEGLRVPSGDTKLFSMRLGGLEAPPMVRDHLAPLRTILDLLDDELDEMDAAVAQLVADDPICTRLMTVPCVGPITAAAFVAALDTVTRFAGAAQVSSYLGLVPQEFSSGEQQRRGRILRSARPQVQSLLVQAAWRMWRSVDPRAAPLRAWARAVANRRGKKIAIVALARRLSRILYALWRDGTTYDPQQIGARRHDVRARVAS